MLAPGAGAAEHVPVRERPTVDELLGAELLSTFELSAQDLDAAVAGSNEHSLAADDGHAARRARRRVRLGSGLGDAQRLVAKPRLSARPRVESANPIYDLARCTRPGDLGVLLLDRRCQARER